MPRYEYYCPDNGQSLVVRHCQSDAIATWGELCQAASTEVGTTPGDALVEQRSQMPCNCASGCDCQHKKHHHVCDERQKQSPLTVLSQEAAEELG